MKFSFKSNLTPFLALGAGIMGMAMRMVLYLVAQGPDGLLQRNHILGILVWVLTAAVLAALFLMTRKITGPEEYRDCYHPSLIGGIGAILAAAAMAITSAQSAGGDNLTMICNLLGYVCAAALVAMGLCRFSGINGSFLLPSALCIYFAVRMICQYRSWSADPQLQDYGFHLLACVSLMLTSYHHAAFGADMGSHKKLWFFSLISVYFCALSLAGPEEQLFYLGTGLWAFTNLTNLSPRRRRRRPLLNMDEPREE